MNPEAFVCDAFRIPVGCCGGALAKVRTRNTYQRTDVKKPQHRLGTEVKCDSWLCYSSR